MLQIHQNIMEMHQMEAFLTTVIWIVGRQTDLRVLCQMEGNLQVIIDTIAAGSYPLEQYMLLTIEDLKYCT